MADERIKTHLLGKLLFGEQDHVYAHFLQGKGSVCVYAALLWAVVNDPALTLDNDGRSIAGSLEVQIGIACILARERSRCRRKSDGVVIVKWPKALSTQARWKPKKHGCLDLQR